MGESADVLPPDPGMAAKMAPPSVPALDRAVSDAVVDPAAVHELLDFIDQRLDCADFRMVTVLKLLYVAGDRLDPDLAAAMKRSVLGFAYWMDEPGVDAMCQWSENHQALFAVCELLAGQLYPDEIFGDSGFTGQQRRERGTVRIRRWLEHRFRFGFTEWLSTTYYEEDAAALALLIDHAADPDLVTRAQMVLDLLLIDMALHRFDGHLVGTAGRAYEAQKQDPRRADVNDILAHAFGGDPQHEPDLRRISGMFVLARRYETPAAIRAVAEAGGSHVIRESTGLELHEVAGHAGDSGDPETTAAFFWQMEAFTNAESIDATIRAFKHWHLEHNRFLSPLAPFAKLAAVPGASRSLPTLVRALNPATQGVAIQRANIYAYRTPHFHLSSAQSYHAGEFGDQQHIWQATLPRNITVFATHPGAPMFESTARNFSPSYWVGNGKNPEVGQYCGTLVALYDVRGRSGYLEKKRQRFTHLFLPTPEFDRVVFGPSWLVAEVEETFLGIRTLLPYDLSSPTELIQRGAVTGYGVSLASREEFRDLEDFQAFIEATSLTRKGETLSYETQGGLVEVRARKGMRVDGEFVSHDFPRYDSPWITAEREPTRIIVTCGGERLELDWETGSRTQSRIGE